MHQITNIPNEFFIINVQIKNKKESFLWPGYLKIKKKEKEKKERSFFRKLEISIQTIQK